MTDVSETPGQELPEFLRYEETLIANTGVDAETLSPFVFPEDPDEETYILFKMSQRQYTAILSSVDTGSIICYGAGAMQVYWWFVRNTELSMPFCEQIINCMMSDQDTRDSVINMLLNSPQFIDGIKDIAGGRQPINPGEIVNPIVETCDKDILFGAITRVVDGMNTNNIDAFEIMEEATNDEERAVLLIEAVPILAEFVPAELVDIAQQLVENMQENYDAEWTAALRDEIRMDLLCIAEKECQLTVGMIYDYFSQRIGGSLNIATGFLDAARFLAYGDFPGVQVVNFAMMFQAVALRGGSAFFGQTLYSVELQAALGANNPDNDWTLLEPADCPDDDEPTCTEYTLNPATSLTIGADTGVYVRAGQLVQITATGTYSPYEGATFGPEGLPEGSPLGTGMTDPTAIPYELVARVGTTNPYHPIGVEGEFTAETDGHIRVTVNEAAIDEHFGDNTGSLVLEICLDPLPIVLQKTADIYKLKLISENGGEPIYEIETVYTGHYAVHLSVEINGTPFYIKSIQVITVASEWSYPVIGLGTTGIGYYSKSNIPADLPTVQIGIQQVGPGKKLRFTLTTTPGATGTFVPVTEGP